MESAAAGLKKVLEEIEAGEIKPVYLVSGDEDFLIREAIKGIIDSLLPGKTRELNLQVFETEEDWPQIIQSLSTFGWFGARRVIVVKDSRIFVSKFNVENLAEKSLSHFAAGNREEGIRLYRIALGYKGYEKIEDIPEGDLGGLPGFNDDAKTRTLIKEILGECREQEMHPIPYTDSAEELSAALKEGIPENNVLVLGTKEVDRRRSLYKTIAAAGAVIDLSMSVKPWDVVGAEREEKNLLHAQADKLLKKSGKSLEPDGFDLLFAKTGFQIGIFMNELEKLISFTGQPKITAADVAAIVGRTKEDSIADLQEALSRKDFGNVVFYLRELLAQGEFYLVLLQSIVAQVRRLMLAKDFMEGERKEKWNPQMNEEAFLKRIYFPLILPKKREREAAEKEGRRRKGAPNIYKMPSNVLFRLFRGAQNFTREELENALRTLADADLELKSARIPPIFILEEALMSLCMPQSGGMEGKIRGAYRQVKEGI